LKKAVLLFLFLLLIPVPSGADSENHDLTIATFNLGIFGPTKSSKPEVVDAIANIVRMYDIVALQEIKDVSGKAPQVLIDAVRSKGGNWRMELSPRSGLQTDDGRSQEQYAFIYNGDKIDLSGDARLFDDEPRDLFQREPFVARFRHIKGNFSFVMINIHTKPGRIEEIGSLNDVYWWALFEFFGDDNFVILGDLNAGCDYASPGDLDRMEIRGDNFLWITPDGADTNFSDSRCAYDRIIVNTEMATRFKGDQGVNKESVSSREISDHLPVWAKFQLKGKGKRRNNP